MKYLLAVLTFLVLSCAHPLVANRPAEEQGDQDTTTNEVQAEPEAVVEEPAAEETPATEEQPGEAGQAATDYQAMYEELKNRMVNLEKLVAEIVGVDNAD